MRPMSARRYLQDYTAACACQVLRVSGYSRIGHYSDGTSRTDYAESTLPRGRSHGRLQRCACSRTDSRFFRPAAGRHWRGTAMPGPKPGAFPYATCRRTPGPLVWVVVAIIIIVVIISVVVIAADKRVDFLQCRDKIGAFARRVQRVRDDVADAVEGVLQVCFCG